MALQPLWTLPHFQLLNLYTVGRIPWTGDHPFVMSLVTRRTTQTQNKRTQTSMPKAGFEPTIPVCERAKTIYVIDRAANVIGEIIVLLLLTQNTGLIKCTIPRTLLDTCVVITCGCYSSLLISA
jgi:hypothetical protein